jgi:hypothetical protein
VFRTPVQKKRSITHTPICLSWGTFAKTVLEMALRNYRRSAPESLHCNTNNIKIIWSLTL